MPDLDTIEAKYRVVTPMFVGGADPEKAEFRLPSFKGMLRFWWRALAWGRFDGNLEEIHQQEAELFGSADSDIGQAKFVMKADGDFPDPIPANRNLIYQQGTKQGQTVESGVCYLGYGVLDYKGELERQCLPPNFEFTIRVLPKPNLDPELRESLVDALQAVGLFGSLGSRVRRGFGSLTLVNCDGACTTSSIDSLRRCFQSTTRDAGTGPVPEGLPDYTAFSQRSKVFGLVGDEDLSPLEFMQVLGQQMKEVRGEYSSRDADIMRSVAERGESPDGHPSRVAFGLPHNYFFKNSGATAGVAPADDERRASPLWIKIHELDDGRPVAFLQYFPAEFGAGDTVHVGPHEVELQFDDAFWNPVVNYANSFLKKGECILHENDTFYFAIFE